jgi:hypothetical protein
MLRKGSPVIEAGAVTFTVEQQQWDGNIHSHPDQGVIVMVRGDVDGEDTAMLQFNCFDVEHSYTYAPEGKARKCYIDPITDGNAISWSIRTMRKNLPAMLDAAGFGSVAKKVDMKLVDKKLSEVDVAARDQFFNRRGTVKHNRGTDMFEAGNIRFGLELRTLGDDGGLAIHVLSDVVGKPSDPFAEETEMLAFDCFRLAPHYHYGPRNKNHRIYWDKTLVPDTLEWTLDVLKARKLRQMIDQAGYPGVAADLDEELIASVLPDLEKRAREMQPKLKAVKGGSKSKQKAKAKAKSKPKLKKAA